MTLGPLLDILPLEPTHHQVETVGPLPTDYLDFVRHYGPGTIDGFLTVLMPGGRSRYCSVASETLRLNNLLKEILFESVKTGVPSYLPNVERLLVWGIGDNGEACFWRTDSEDPQLWTVVIADSRQGFWFEFDGGMVSFLIEYLSHKLDHCKALPELAGDHVFVAWTGSSDE